MKPSKERFSRIDSFFETAVAEGKLAGAIALTSRNGRTIHSGKYGYSDIERSIPMPSNALIPIASMTKVFTSMAVLMLYEEGRFLLNDPIESCLPEFKDARVFTDNHGEATEKARTPPTIRDFLRHCSGMVYTSGDTPADKRCLEAGFRTWQQPLKNFVKTIAGIPLACHPGERWIYSYSYDVLGYLVETVSGMPLDKFCAQRIFTPLGMKDSAFHVPPERANRLPAFYLYDGDRLVIDEPREGSVYATESTALSGGGGWWSAHGGIVTTVADFHIAAELLLNFGKRGTTRLLSRKAVELMIANHVGDKAGSGKGYGLGVGIITSAGDYGEMASANEIYWAGAPYNTHFRIDYREKTIGILFTNTAPFGHLDMMEKFRVLSQQACDSRT